MQKLTLKTVNGYKQTEIGVIPLDWEVVRLEKLIKIISGQSPSKFNLDGSKYKFFKVNQLNYCEKYLTDSEYLFDEEIENLLDEGTIIFPKRGASIFTNKVRILTHKSFIDTNLMGLISNKKLNNIFLYYWLLKFKLSSIADTSSIPQINNKHINPLKIPLPPLIQQEKIAQILSTTDNKIEAITKQIEKAQILKKGLMQRLLSDESWEYCKLEDISIKITSGGTPSRSKEEYFQNGTINWLKTGELKDCYIYNSKEKITEEAIKNSSAKLFPIDTLLIAMYGATIGQTAYLKTECATNQACCAIIFDKKIANPFFYWKYFYFIKDSLIGLGRGAGQPNISQGIIKELKIPFPPLKEQQKIANILSKADQKIEVLKVKKEQYKTLKIGLMQKLLTGEVRV